MSSRRVLLVALLVLTSASAQLSRGVPVPVPDLKLPSPAELLRQEPTLSTTFAEALPRLAWFDAYRPPAWTPGGALPLQPHGAWRLTPGDYVFELQSYCLQPGTHGPQRDQGDGYLNGPLRGAKAELIRAVLQRAAQHPEVAQPNIQALLWAIIARVDLVLLQGPAADAAKVLLTPAERAGLEDKVWSALSSKAKRELREAMAPLDRAVFDAEDRLRGLASRPNVSYAQLERVAIARGRLAPDPQADTTPTGSWCLHPGGYVVCYLPDGYAHTTVLVHVPAPVHWSRDAAGRIRLLAAGDGRRIEVLYAPPGPTSPAYRGLQLTYGDPLTGALRSQTIAPAGRLGARPAAPGVRFAVDGPGRDDFASLTQRLQQRGAPPAEVAAVNDLAALRSLLRDVVEPYDLGDLCDDALLGACLGQPVPPPPGAGTPGSAGADTPDGGGTPGGNQGTPGGEQGGAKTPGGDGANTPDGGGNPGGNQGAPGGDPGGASTPGGDRRGSPDFGGVPDGNDGSTPRPEGDQPGADTPDGGGAGTPDGGGAPEGNHNQPTPDGGGGTTPGQDGTVGPDGGRPDGHRDRPQPRPRPRPKPLPDLGEGWDYSGVDFDPTDGAAVPAHSGRQRLGISARPSRDGQRTTPPPGGDDRHTPPGGEQRPTPDGTGTPGGVSERVWSLWRWLAELVA